MTSLKERLNKEEILVVPGTHDVLTAKIIEDVGFEAVFNNGFSASASILGQPDVGLLTMNEMVSRTANIANVVNNFIFADADTGFGNAINVQRTISQLEAAGAQAIMIEDQVAPKKCGHMFGREVISREEMVGKVKAAVDARRSDDTLIIARTDARTDYGIDEAIERGIAYQEAGADIVFVESVESIEEMKQVNEALDAFSMANMVEGGSTPILTAQELQEYGYDLVVFPNYTVFTAAKAVQDALIYLKENDTTTGNFENIITFQEFTDLIGLPEVREAESRYATGRDKVEKKQEVR